MCNVKMNPDDDKHYCDTQDGWFCPDCFLGVCDDEDCDGCETTREEMEEEEEEEVAAPAPEEARLSCQNSCLSCQESCLSCQESCLSCQMSCFNLFMIPLFLTGRAGAAFARGVERNVSWRYDC